MFTSLHRWIVIVFVLWFGSYSYLYVFSQGGPKPLYSYFALLGVFLLWAAFFWRLDRITFRGVSAFIAWLALYVIYGLLGFFNSTQSALSVQALITLLEAVLIAVAFVLMMADRASLKAVMKSFALLSTVGAVLNIWDFLYPTFSKVPGRAAGFYINPTISGNFIAIAMIAGLTAIPRRFRLLYLMCCGIGVLVTFSRESWIIWGVAVVGVGWSGYVGKGRHRPVAIILATLLGVGSIFALFSGLVGGFIAQTSLTRYLDQNTTARLGIGASTLSGFAARERENVIVFSLREGEKAPVFGHGLGYTDEWKFRVGPHDMFLLFFVEGGIVGLMLYVVLMITLWQHSEQFGKIITVQIILSSFFTHNHLNQPAIVMIIAFVVAHGAITRAERYQDVSIPQVVKA